MNGAQELAASIKQKTIDIVLKYYLQFGSVFEFYDATDEVGKRSALVLMTVSTLISDHQRVLHASLILLLEEYETTIGLPRLSSECFTLSRTYRKNITLC